jgi:transcription elongation factor GreA
MGNELPIVKKLQADLEKLDREYRIDLPRQIQEAAAQGDLSDNAEYQDAKQRQELTRARIIHLKERLSSLSLINLSSIPRGRVGFGSTVTIEDDDDGAEKVYHIVLPEEVDAAAGKISVRSPVGQALVGREEGDEVTIRTPGGTGSYTISRLITIHDLKE